MVDQYKELVGLMSHYPYLVVGGGMTADAAVRGIRELDSQGEIGLIGAEADPPYARPPLSKALWKGEPVESVWRKTSEVAGVDLHLGRRATSVDAHRKTVVDDSGASYTFDKLLLATGGTPRRLTSGGNDVIYFRTLGDYRKLRALAEQGKSFAVVGGGFIGSEIAAALRLQGCKVTLIAPGEGIGARLFPPDLAAFLVDLLSREGRGRPIGTGHTHQPRRIAASSSKTDSGDQMKVDAVVAGIGIVPNTELAAAAGLLVDDGIVVNEHLQTSHTDIFAAGDVARFEAPALGTRIRVEHEDNALTMGHAAGRAMAGDPTPYTHLPSFYSDLFDLGYEAVGAMDPQGETVADWKDAFREGVVYYLASGTRTRRVALEHLGPGRCRSGTDSGAGSLQQQRSQGPTAWLTARAAFRFSTAGARPRPAAPSRHCRSLRAAR